MRHHAELVVVVVTSATLGGGVFRVALPKHRIAPEPTPEKPRSHKVEAQLDALEGKAPTLGPPELRFALSKNISKKGPLPQISPLRSFGAPVEMTKGRAVLPGKVAAE
jgi:hypothetical protein